MGQATVAAKSPETARAMKLNELSPSGKFEKGKIKMLKGLRSEARTGWLMGYWCSFWVYSLRHGSGTTMTRARSQ
jgi:hypothetical protein